MTVYHITCGSTLCEIHLKQQARIGAEPIYVATPYLVGTDELTPFAGTSDPHAELQGESAVSAIEEACEFLEHRLGRRGSAPFEVTAEGADRKRIGAPREIPILSGANGLHAESVAVPDASSASSS